MFGGKRVFVVVPAYNEEKLIGKTLTGIPAYVDKVIVVDDSSVDNTASTLEKLVKKNGKIIAIRHALNKGVGGAIITGYKRAIEENADIAVVMAGDAQMNPDKLKDLLIPVIKGDADYAKGNRLLTKNAREIMPGIRYMGNSILTILTKISSGYWSIMDPQCGYTAIKSETIKRIQWDRIYQRYGFENELLIEMNIQDIRVRDVPVDAVYGTEKSKIKILSFIPNVLRILAGGFFRRLIEKYIVRDFHPLVLFYLGGFSFLTAGGLLSAWILYHRIILAELISAPTVILCAFLLIMGLQSIFFAMWLDMEYNKKLG